MENQSEKTLKNTTLRNLEYYGIQEELDDLYKRSKNNEKFQNLTNMIMSEDNIMLAYRNVKSNQGSFTPSVDKKTIRDVERLAKEDFVQKIRNIYKHYTPRVIRRKEIPKPNGKTRPLGIPSIWDRMLQQAILQILEPICEAKFINESYGFRPNCSAEQALAKAEQYINLGKNYYVVDVDIKGFFDEVSHVKLMRQLWALGIQDKQLLVVVRKMLKAPVQLPNGKITVPTKGTPQGGILSPLLANINLNEFDHWIKNQWANRDIPQVQKQYKANGIRIRSNEYRYLKSKTKLKPMYIVRYADDFKIFTNNRSNAEKIFKATRMWLQERLKLPISLEKSKVTNLKKDYSEFLGFTIKARKKGKKRVSETHVSDKAKAAMKQKLSEQIKTIQRTGVRLKTIFEINKYNSMVMGMHNYYGIANQVNHDLDNLGRGFDVMMYHRFQKAKKRGTDYPSGYTRRGKYGGKDIGLRKYIDNGSKTIRYYMKRPIISIRDVRTRKPTQKAWEVNKYTPEGRKLIHKELKSISASELEYLRNIPIGTGKRASIKLYDNRIALYIAQKGKCSVTGEELFGRMHLHHKKLWSETQDNSYQNLTLILESVHKLVHATRQKTIKKYLLELKLNEKQIEKLNKLRKLVGNPTINSITQNG